MKHSLTFVIIMALILSLGYYSVDLAGFFSESSRLENTNLPRSAKDSGAVYISGEESGFHPMELVENSSFAQRGPYSDYDRNIISALVAVISMCNKKSEMNADDGEKLAENLNFTDNGYIYAEKFSYVNSYSEERFLDCIFTSADRRIVYLNFYSQEEPTPTPEETESALNTFDSQSGQFYFYVEDYTEKLRKDFEANDVYANSDYKITDPKNMFDCFYDAYTHFYCFTITFLSVTQPVALFWMSPVYFCNVFFNDDDIDYGLNAIGITHIVEKMTYSSRISDPQYTIYQGRIYQSIFFDRSELITIYNIHDQCIEGFYAPVYT